MIRLFDKLNKFFTNLQPFSLLALRFWIAAIFWQSGVNKLANMDTAILLFENEYSVPLLSPTIAAYLATSAELILPILLFVGLATRLAAFGLLLVTLIIQAVYPNFSEHYVWAIILFTIIGVGAGAFSMDYQFFAEKEDTQSKMKKVLAPVMVAACCIFTAHEIFAAYTGGSSWLAELNSFIHAE